MGTGSRKICGMLGSRFVSRAACDDLSPSPERQNLVYSLTFSLSTVSLAASKAGAAARGVPLWKHYADIAGNPTPDVLPVPCFNVINGGEHAGNKLAFQEFFVIPTGAETFSESMQIGCEVFHNLKSVIKVRRLLISSAK